jgi:hypothetical protein
VWLYPWSIAIKSESGQDGFGRKMKQEFPFHEIMGLGRIGLKGESHGRGAPLYGVRLPSLGSDAWPPFQAHAVSHCGLQLLIRDWTNQMSRL